MIKIAFIACSKTKKGYPTEARKLYQGALFKKALAYTEQHFDQVYILSALYGVVELTQVIKPYERTLDTMPAQERKEWAVKVKTQLKEKGLLKNELWFFTGRKYHEHFEGNKPLEGLSCGRFGRQLQWFNQKLKQQKNNLL